MNTIFLLTRTRSKYSTEKEAVQAFARPKRAEQAKELIEKCDPSCTLEIIEIPYSTELAE